jgi:hypothetical protein
MVKMTISRFEVKSAVVSRQFSAARWELAALGCAGGAYRGASGRSREGRAGLGAM